MDEVYLKRRQKVNYTSYRLKKRTEVVIDSLKKLKKTSDGFKTILDIGTADGKMLAAVADYFNIACSVGIDISNEAIGSTGQLKNIKVSLADTRSLPFKNESFDALLACAVLEHIKDIEKVLDEAHRVIKKNGLFCVTLPNPFFDFINSLLVKTYHVRRYRLKTITQIMNYHGFKIVNAHYYMLWPFGQFPLEGHICKFIRSMKLDFMLFNQLIVGEKK